MFKKLTFLLAGAGLVILAACNTDKCKDKNCGTNGTCNILTGACDCSTGYEGADCATLSRTKFLNTYNRTVDTVTSNSVTTYPSSYTVVVTSRTNGTAVTGIQFRNLGYYSCTNSSGTLVDYEVAGVVTGNKVSISGSSCNTTFSGNGYITGNKINLSYTASYSVGTVTRTDNIQSSLNLN